MTIEEAREHFPGPTPGYHNVHRWATKGYKGIYLESAPVGHRRLTSIEAIARFLDALAAADSDIQRQGIPVVNVSAEEEDARLLAQFAL